MQIKGKPAKKYKVVKEACVLRKGSAGDMNVPEEIVVDHQAQFIQHRSSSTDPAYQTWEIVVLWWILIQTSVMNMWRVMKRSLKHVQVHALQLPVCLKQMPGKQSSSTNPAYQTWEIVVLGKI